VEQGAVGQKLKTHWQGGNLEGVRQFPVRLDRPNKLVYSPHEYGPGVFNHPWFSDKTFPKNLRDRWETGFHYIARRRIAPVLIGEFGGRKVDSVSPEGVWQRSLVEFIRAQQLSYAYWSWNPNSQDTGGLLLEDWKTLDAAKHQMLLPVRQARGIAPAS
jgi:endoglucanase